MYSESDCEQVSLHEALSIPFTSRSLQTHMSRLIFTQGFEFDRSLLDASSQEPYGCLIPFQPSAS